MMTGPRERARPGFAFWAFIAWAAVTVAWWALAFAPLPVAPAWIDGVRAVCFGTLPNGLPEPWGWGGLIVSPLAVLGFLLAVWGGELLTQLRGIGRSVPGRVMLIALAAVPLIGVWWVGQRVVTARKLAFSLQGAGEAAGALPAGYPRASEPAPALNLLDQHGERITLDRFQGRPVLVTFAFAHCQTVCPIVVRTVREAAERLAPQEPSVVVVTLDPWRDTPSSLPTLADSWELAALPGSHVLSGEISEVVAVIEAWNVPTQRDPRDGDISHPAVVSVVDPAGNRAYTFVNPPVEWVVQAARRTLGEADLTAASRPKDAIESRDRAEG